VIARQSELSALCERLGAADVIGVDTEYISDRRFFPELCVIQVASAHESAVIDVQAGLDLSCLGETWKAPTPVVVMHNAPSDVPLLARAVGAAPTSMFDTMIAAGFLGCGELSLRGVVSRFLGRTMEKGSTLTDWSRRPLPAAAIEYAREDVVHLPELHTFLASELASRGRAQWAEEEVRRVTERALEPPDPEQAWRRVDGTRRLRGASLAVAAALAAWRVRTAMAGNRPPRRVISDLAVVAIAEARPTTIEVLTHQRGVDRGVTQKHGHAIVDVVRDAVASDPATWPARRPPPPPELEVVHNALGLAARMVAQSEEIAPWLAYERADLGGLTHDPPRGRLVEGWRAEVLAPPLLDLLHGRLALTVDAGRLTLVTPDRGSP